MPDLSQLGGVTAGDASGGSRDFWISLLKTAVQFPAASGQPANDTAQAGMWLNWRDKLQALSTNGVAPPTCRRAADAARAGGGLLLCVGRCRRWSR
jgi:hypothetical protein